MCRKPFSLTLDEFLDLDDWQIVNVYFRPPTAESARGGHYWPMPPAQCEGDLAATRYVFFREGRRNRIPLKKIKRQWREYKMVLLYGIEGSRTSYTRAMRSVLAARGERPEKIEAAVSARKNEMAKARSRLLREEYIG